MFSIIPVINSHPNLEEVINNINNFFNNKEYDKSMIIKDVEGNYYLNLKVNESFYIKKYLKPWMREFFAQPSTSDVQ